MSNLIRINTMITTGKLQCGIQIKMQQTTSILCNKILFNGIVRDTMIMNYIRENSISKAYRYFSYTSKLWKRKLFRTKLEVLRRVTRTHVFLKTETRNEKNYNIIYCARRKFNGIISIIYVRKSIKSGIKITWIHIRIF